jgi:hypothetical protein
MASKKKESGLAGRTMRFKKIVELEPETAVTVLQVMTVSLWVPEKTSLSSSHCPGATGSEQQAPLPPVYSPARFLLTTTGEPIILPGWATTVIKAL